MSAPGAAGPSTAPIIGVGGLIASGKSTIARALAERLGAPRLEADRVRDTLLGDPGDEPAGAEARWRRDLSASIEQEIYADLLGRADAILSRGEALVVDACFPRRAQREGLRALARRHHRPFLFVTCQVSEERRRARLDERDRASGIRAWGEIDRRLVAHYEPPDELDRVEHLSISSDGPTGPDIEEIERRLGLMPVPSPGASPQMLRPRAVSFDCWGTLMSEDDWAWAHQMRIAAMQQAAREAARDVPFEVAKAAFETAWQRHQSLWEKGEASGATEVADWGLEALGLSDHEPARTHLIGRFEEASHSGRVVAIEGARALLETLTTSGIPCVLVCDTGLTPGRVVRRLLDHNGLLEHLSVQAFSDEVGRPKPDPAPFLAALDPLGIAPADVVHVGDLKRTDVAGARALGMGTVRIRARHDDEADLADAEHVVDSHVALARLLGFRIPT